MADFPSITLHYFDLRGRGQFIRALLSHRKVPYTDNRIKLAKDNSNWPRIRKDRNITGDFQKFPFLQWGDLRLNEVLVILDFIDRELGDAELLDTRAWLQQRQLASSAFLDLLTPCINLIWSDIFQPGTDVARATAIVQHRLETHLATVNQTLQEWGWLPASMDRPVMSTDAVLWEALDAIRMTFDDHVSFEEQEHLATFYEQCPGANTFRKLLAKKHQNLTGRPGEAEALQAIHASLGDNDD